VILLQGLFLGPALKAYSQDAFQNVNKEVAFVASVFVSNAAGLRRQICPTESVPLKLKAAQSLIWLASAAISRSLRAVTSRVPTTR